MSKIAAADRIHAAALDPADQALADRIEDIAGRDRAFPMA